MIVSPVNVFLFARMAYIALRNKDDDHYCWRGLWLWKILYDT